MVKVHFHVTLKSQIILSFKWVEFDSFKKINALKKGDDLNTSCHHLCPCQSHRQSSTLPHGDGHFDGPDRFNHHKNGDADDILTGLQN